jgi:hypothetical protein
MSVGRCSRDLASVTRWSVRPFSFLFSPLNECFVDSASCCLMTQLLFWLIYDGNEEDEDALDGCACVCLSSTHVHRMYFVHCFSACNTDHSVHMRASLQTCVSHMTCVCMYVCVCTFTYIHMCYSGSCPSFCLSACN